ncbi:MAG: hypothetical protein ACRDKT_16470 [Actinomycetota bacterium]
MSNRTRVQGRCPTCGPLTLLPGDVTCSVPDGPEGAGLAEFHCPVCDGPVFYRVTAQDAKVLLLLGGRKATGSVPLELTEEKSGPPVSLDDLVDLHLELERVCCPQAELIGGAGGRRE